MSEVPLYNLWYLSDIATISGFLLFLQAIHEKIKSLELKQVHAKIKQVDSHSTLGNGIVIQVG